MKKLFIAVITLGLFIAMLASCGSPSKDTDKQVGDKKNNIMQDSSRTSDIDKEKLDDNKIEDTVKPNAPSSNESEKKPATDEVQNNTTPNKPSTTPSKPSIVPNIPDTVPNKPSSIPSKPKPEKPMAPAKPEKTYSISEVHRLIQKAYGADYIANTALSKDMLSSLMGINTEEVVEFIAEQPMISANIDTFVAIKTVGGKGVSVEAALSAYKAKLTSPEAMVYPSNIPKAQAAQVVRHGDYIFFVMLGACNNDANADDAAQLKFAKAQVQKGVNVINNYFAK